MEGLTGSTMYRCPSCGATKEIVRSAGMPWTDHPADLPCGFRGCMDRAVRDGR